MYTVQGNSGTFSKEISWNIHVVYFLSTTLSPSQHPSLNVSQGTWIPSEFPRICQNIQLQQEQLHGPRQHLPCMVINGLLGIVLLWHGSFLSPCSTSLLWLLKQMSRVCPHGSGKPSKLFNGWTRAGGLVLQYPQSSEKTSGLYPYSQTDRVLSVQLSFCSSFTQPNFPATHWIQSLPVFFFFFSFFSFWPWFVFHLVCQYLCECVSDTKLHK